MWLFHNISIHTVTFIGDK